MPYKLLIISFDAEQHHALKLSFAQTQYQLINIGHANISSENIRKIQPDLGIIVGDSPEAITMCGKIKNISSMPIIVLTKNRESITELAAIKNGADDYLEFDPTSPTLQYKIQRLLMNRGIRPQIEIPSAGLSLDLDRREFRLAGLPIHLTRTEFELIRILMENQHRVVDRRELIERLWGGWQQADHVLEVHLSRLRGKILRAGGKNLFQSVRGIGYRLH
ncbi:MAG: hypothetical protein RL038_1286 [Actinomycetota bacterium]